MTNSLVFKGIRRGNVYVVDLEDLAKNNPCLVASDTKANDISWLWHRKLGHASMDTISKLVKRDSVIGLPKLKFEKNKICEACQYGKQSRSSFKSINCVTTTRPLELLHMDLFGPTRTTSLGGNKYGLVIVDDFSRYTWVMFLAHKDEAFSVSKKFHKEVTNSRNASVIAIRSDHGTEFENHLFDEFCSKKGTTHNFSAPRTPQ